MLIQRWYVEGLKESFSYFGFWCGGGGYSADFFDLFFFSYRKIDFKKTQVLFIAHNLLIIVVAFHSFWMLCVTFTKCSALLWHLISL